MPLVVVAVMSAGCGASLRSSIDAWHPSGRVSQLDAADRALLARMVVDTPTDDAMDAREHIDELGEVGDEDVRALLSSSLSWLEVLRDSGALDRLPQGACSRPNASKSTDDVIGGLSEPRDLDGVTPLPVASHLWLWAAWTLPIVTETCRRDLRVLRSLAITRAHLGAHVDDRTVLDVLDLAIARLSGRPAIECSSDDATQIRVAVTRHFFAFAPPSFERPDDACRVATVFGLVASAHVLEFEEARGCRERDVAPSPETASDSTRYDFEDALEGCGLLRESEPAYRVTIDLGVLLDVFVARRDGVWRVVAEGAHAIVG